MLSYCLRVYGDEVVSVSHSSRRPSIADNYYYRQQSTAYRNIADTCYNSSIYHTDFFGSAAHARS